MCSPPLEMPLLDALEREFRRMTGTTIDREDWNWDQVPDHLKITFRVVDDKNKKLQEGRSLTGQGLLHFAFQRLFQRGERTAFLQLLVFIVHHAEGDFQVIGHLIPVPVFAVNGGTEGLACAGG